MSEAQLSIRSNHAVDLARRLAKEQHRTVTKIVELALEDFARKSGSGTRSWTQFVEVLQSMPREPDEPDIDLAELAREDLEPHRGVDLE